MKRLLWIFCAFIFPISLHAQEHDWAFGIYSDLKLDDAAYDASFGVQGKYDFNNRSAVQAQIHGRGDLLAVGADYVVSIFNKEKSNFNIFLGAGLGQEFFTYENARSEEHTSELQSRENLVCRLLLEKKNK